MPGSLLPSSSVIGGPLRWIDASGAVAVYAGPSSDVSKLSVWFCLFRRRKKNQSRPAMIATEATPPTTPPAMAPVLVEDLLLVTLLPVVVDGVDVVLAVVDAIAETGLVAVDDEADVGVAFGLAKRNPSRD